MLISQRLRPLGPDVDVGATTMAEPVPHRHESATNMSERRARLLAIISPTRIEQLLRTVVPRPSCGNQAGASLAQVW